MILYCALLFLQILSMEVANTGAQGVKPLKKIDTECTLIPNDLDHMHIDNNARLGITYGAIAGAFDK